MQHRIGRTMVTVALAAAALTIPIAVGTAGAQDTLTFAVGTTQDIDTLNGTAGVLVIDSESGRRLLHPGGFGRVVDRERRRSHVDLHVA